MNREFRQPINISYSNTSTRNKELNFRFIKPDMLKANLDAKKLRIQKFTVNNKYVPVFIPERMLPNDIGLFQEYIGPGTLTRSGFTLGGVVNSSNLKYWIIIRKKDGTQSGIIYLNQIPEVPNIPVPPVPIIDETSYYENEYYWYHDFTNFLTIVTNAITFLGGQMGIPIGAIETVNIEMDLANQGYNWYLPLILLKDYDVEINKELLDIFPLKAVPSTIASPALQMYKILFGKFIDVNDNIEYKTLSCEFYESTFPFTQLLIRSEDINVNPTQFITDITVAQNIPPQNLNAIILEFDIRTKQYNQIYDFWSFTNNNDSLWSNFKIEDTSPSTHVSLSFELRMRNGIIIPMKLLPKELLTVTFEIKSEL